MTNTTNVPEFATDQDQADWVAANLYTAVVSDALDSIGLRNQSLLSDVRPLDESLVLAGRAKTARWEPVDPKALRLANPYEKEMEYLDSGRPGEVFVMSVGRHPEIVPWGELLSTACRVRGARGLIADGLVRDTRKIIEMKLPVFCTGRRPLDSAGRGEVVAYDESIQIDSVSIEPGDFVIGDADGVVIIPRGVEKTVLSIAWSKVVGENRTRDALLTGRLLRDVYDEFGVL